MAELTVRPAGVEDAESFVRAYEESWDAALAGLAGRALRELSPYEERLEAFRKTFGAGLPPGAGAWVADADGEIVGVAVRTGPELRSLYVVPGAWGTGAAQVLIAAAVAAIRADGHDEATLWVVDENPRARRFYEREGWEPTGETRASELGPAELRYRRRLSQEILATDP
jgi:GNAT superfamily N-acetyltransferase